MSQSSDHETRLRAIEATRFVTSSQLWALMTGLMSLITVAVYVLDLVVK